MNIVDHRMSVWGEILLYILMGSQRQKRTMLFKLGKQVSPEVGTSDSSLMEGGRTFTREEKPDIPDETHRDSALNLNWRQKENIKHS